jgi:hypothetical protein
MIMILQVTKRKPIVISTGIGAYHHYAFILSTLLGGLKDGSLTFDPLPDSIFQMSTDVLRR